MSAKIQNLPWSAFKSKYLLTAAAAVMLSACSNSVERFAENPSDADPVYTASVPKQKAKPSQVASVSDDEISSSPLDSGSSQPPKYDYTRSYQKPAYKQPAEAPSAPQPRLAAAESPSAPSGGTVQVGPGMTLYSIARSNNLSVAELAAANNIKPPYAVHNGQKLRIPGASNPSTPDVASAPAPRRMEAQPARAEAPSAMPSSKGTHTVGSGETLYSLGRKYNVSPFAIADANGLQHNTQLRLGQQVRIPSGGSSGNVPFAKASDTAAPKQTASRSQSMPAAETVEDAPSSKQAVADIPAPKAETAPAPQAEAMVQEQAPMGDSANGMRWPVRGKVISGFGPKSNGLKNEGINIAVPEGTSVRAAENGVIAYAGNELKGYGNLVLIRHDNGYVTAYAHAKELFVKRGDTVKRGDVIAKAGQTGSVSSPQLHFEVRKGATALDPMKFLSSSTASN